MISYSFMANCSFSGLFHIMDRGETSMMSQIEPWYNQGLDGQSHADVHLILVKTYEAHITRP